MAVKKVNDRLQITVSKDLMHSLNEVSKQLGVSKTDLLLPVLTKFVRKEQRRIRQSSNA